MESIDWCGCMKVHSLFAGLTDIFSMKKKNNGEMSGELWELISAILKGDAKKTRKEAILGEMSDIAWALGRTIGGFRGKAYVRFPGDGRSFATKSGRMKSYNCMRSVNNLVDGHCPNLKGE